MKLGIIGLGRMGAAVADRAVKGGFEIVGFDQNTQSRDDAQACGVILAEDISHLVQECDTIWLMVPAGDIVDEVLRELEGYVQPGTVIIDGGNSHFPDTVRRYKRLAKKQVSFVDCGVSGGVKGREIGFSIMVGGDRESFATIEPLLKVLAAPDGYGYMGPSGAGHYVKMVHNGVEYALLQAYAEGLHLLRDGQYPDLDLAEITKVWSNGSVIRSWIVELLHEITSEDQTLADVPGAIGENKTGRWTLEEAEKRHVPVAQIEAALTARSWSRETGGNFGTKLVALLRNKFGGHPLEKKSE